MCKYGEERHPILLGRSVIVDNKSPHDPVPQTSPYDKIWQCSPACLPSSRPTRYNHNRASHFKVLQLLVLAFLSSENIKTVKLNQLGDIRIPLPPAITIRRVTRISVTQIISGNYHRLRLQRKNTEQRRNKKNKLASSYLYNYF